MFPVDGLFGKACAYIRKIRRMAENRLAMTVYFNLQHDSED